MEIGVGKKCRQATKMADKTTYHTGLSTSAASTTLIAV